MELHQERDTPGQTACPPPSPQKSQQSQIGMEITPFIIPDWLAFQEKVPRAQSVLDNS